MLFTSVCQPSVWFVQNLNKLPAFLIKASSISAIINAVNSDLDWVIRCTAKEYYAEYCLDTINTSPIVKSHNSYLQLPTKQLRCAVFLLDGTTDEDRLSLNLGSF